MAVRTAMIEGNSVLVLKLTVSSDDLAQVIGRHGKTIGALRVIAESIARRLQQRCVLEVCG